MKTHILACLCLAAGAASTVAQTAMAAEFYVVRDTATKKCTVVDTKPTTSTVTIVDNGTYKKHYLGLSDNVTFFAEQIDGVAEGTSHYKVTFKPSVIIPDVQLR